MSSRGDLRASDADREHVVERLRAAAGEGRLSPDELSERVHAALSAMTYRQLRQLTADLPRPGETPERRRQRRPTLGAWALSSVRAHPLLLVVMIPLVATAGAMLLAAAMTWMTLLAVVMLLGAARGHRIAGGRRGPWTLMWSAEDRW